MPSNVCTPFYETSDISFIASAAVTGKRFVVPSANRSGGPGLSTDASNLYKMAHATAGAKAFGVAVYDVDQDGLGRVIGTPGRIVPVTADGAITVGDAVSVGSNGKAKTATAMSQGASGPYAVTEGSVIVGIAMTGAADGNDAEIKLIN